MLEDYVTTYQHLTVPNSRQTVRLEAELRKTFNCLNYIRQSLMCFADTALEGLDPYAEAESRIGTLGIGTTHVCRNYQTIKKFADVNRS